ncbi:MAG: hypothetical protein IKN89_00490 [Oscillospiraceae bacterium]|nr:hypothetical protein [Oscillospiraceae bacterium]
MNFLVSLIIGVGWLVVAFINIGNHSHWAMILLNFALAAFFLIKAFRKISQAAREDMEAENRKGKSKKK